MFCELETLKLHTGVSFTNLSNLFTEIVESSEPERRGTAGVLQLSGRALNPKMSESLKP